MWGVFSRVLVEATLEACGDPGRWTPTPVIQMEAWGKEEISQYKAGVINGDSFYAVSTYDGGPHS